MCILTYLLASAHSYEIKIAERRTFVKTAGSAAAALTLLPGFSFASSNTVEFTVENLAGGGPASGTFQIELDPSLAPLGVERFQSLISTSFFNDCRFFRVVPNFVAQFGINGDPILMAKYRSQTIKDDPVAATNARGSIVFATSGKDSRTTQLFINLKDNAFLDKSGFSPIGKIVSGMDIVDQLYQGYGEGAPSGKGPSQAMLQLKGNTYLNDKFPLLSTISKTEFK